MTNSIISVKCIKCKNFSFCANQPLQIYFYTFDLIQKFGKNSLHLIKYSEESIAFFKTVAFQLDWECIFCETHWHLKTFWHIFLTQKLLSEEGSRQADYVTMVWEKYNNLHTLGTWHLCPVYDLRHNCEYSSRDVVKKSFKA